jgi:hypothetical protein
MKNNRAATHNHKREGAVVLLESTTELARVAVLRSGDEYWVKLVDLTPSAVDQLDDGKSTEKRVKRGLSKPGVRAA